MKSITHKNYTVSELDTGTIQATKNNQITSPTKPILREIAKELNLSIEDKNGTPLNTRQLGSMIIRSVNNSYKKAHEDASQEGVKNIPSISFMYAIKRTIKDSPLTPQEIREQIKINYPYLYGTETHQRNVDKGHYTDIHHAVLAQIYSQTKDNKDFFIDKSTKPLTIGLNRDSGSFELDIQNVIDNYLRNYKYVSFYLNKGDKLEKVLTENGVPNHYGIYIIYAVKESVDDIIYIGKAGSMMTNGEFKKQGIKNRLKAVGTNNIPRSKYFQDVIDELKIEKLKFLWIETFNALAKEIPAYVESKLIQVYYDQYGNLPMLNKSK